MLAKKIALGFGIAIILPMMIHYGVSSFVPRPEWHEYQVENYHERHQIADAVTKLELEAEQVELDEAYERDEHYFQKTLFFVAVPLGLVSILIGAFMDKKSLGAGLMLGGIFSICNGYLNNWDYLDHHLKFISLLIAFLLLLWTAFKKIDHKQPEKTERL